MSTPGPPSAADTGRIRQPLDWRARQLLLETDAESAFEDELPLLVKIDRAHAAMLVARGLLSADRAQRVLRAIDELESKAFAPLRDRPTPRGLYLAYESWLVEAAGDWAGGALHLGRSRNDLNATVFRLRLRPVYDRVLREGLRLLAVLVRHSERHATRTMPVYTHYQAAQPVTYGHYLTGVASAIVRDLHGLTAAAADLECCPLGAGAAGGTTVPLDTERTARLLGFTRGVRHSIDAVASRDTVLRLLGAATVLGVTVSRLAADLQLWSTAEFDFIRFPDSLIGSSSMMPQKRNPFVLEHIKGRSAAPLGAMAAAATAMHATPFSNSVAVSAEALRPFWGAMSDLGDALLLTRVMVAGAQPQAPRLRARALDGFTCATELANALVRATDLSFRQAHHRVGALITAAGGSGEAAQESARALLREAGFTEMCLDPDGVAAHAAFGGGPAMTATGRVTADLRRQFITLARCRARRLRRWAVGDRHLDAAVARVLQARGIRPPRRPAAAATRIRPRRAAAERRVS